MVEGNKTGGEQGRFRDEDNLKIFDHCNVVNTWGLWKESKGLVEYGDPDGDTEWSKKLSAATKLAIFYWATEAMEPVFNAFR